MATTKSYVYYVSAVNESAVQVTGQLLGGQYTFTITDADQAEGDSAGILGDVAYDVVSMVATTPQGGTIRIINHYYAGTSAGDNTALLLGDGAAPIRLLVTDEPYAVGDVIDVLLVDVESGANQYDLEAGTAINVQVPCYLAGTRILTSVGEVPVERLVPGDVVMVRRGEGLVPAPVVWVGRRVIEPARHAGREAVWPVRISAGALGEGVPKRDLLVSRDHCLLIDGQLVEAHWLVNGASITIERGLRKLEYLHVELERHGILVAEGALAESYLDTGNRGMFGNAAVVALHPDFACAPRMVERESLLALTARLVAWAERLGWRRSREPGVHLLADGLAIWPRAKEGRVLRFDLPAGVRALRLCSAHGVPRAVKAGNLDGRQLGVCIGRLAYARGGEAVAVAPEGPGFHAAERKGDAVFAWTDGDADLGRVMAPVMAAGGEVMIEVVEIQTSWLAPVVTAWPGAKAG